MNTEQLKTADKTLLDQIKDQVAEKYGQISWKYAMQNNGSHGISALWEIVCERFATAKAQESCEATLKKAAENAKIAHPRHDDEDYEVNTNSITDPSNITIV